MQQKPICMSNLSCKKLIYRLNTNYSQICYETSPWIVLWYRKNSLKDFLVIQKKFPRLLSHRFIFIHWSFYHFIWIKLDTWHLKHKQHTWRARSTIVLPVFRNNKFQELFWDAFLNLHSERQQGVLASYKAPGQKQG